MAPRKKPVKPPRRKPGTGTVRYKPGREKPYEAAFPIGGGEYRYEYFGHAEDAHAHLDRLTEARDHKERPRNIAKGSQTVIDFLTAWLRVKAAHVEPKTLQDYKYQCDLVAGQIGRYRLDQVDLLMCDTTLATFARQGYKNVKQMRAVMVQAFEYALDNDYISRNPWRKATAPVVKHRKRLALTERQRALLLDVAARDDRPGEMPLEPLWHLYSRLAFRRGEALGLRWSDINFDAATITIAQQRTTEGTKTVTKPGAKGGKSRTVPLPADLVDMLRAFQKAQMRRAAADPAWQLTGLVFVGEHGRAPAAQQVGRRLNRLKKQAGLPGGLVVHDLRHTCLFLLEQAGVAPSARMALAGHSTASMALHYTNHASVEDVRRAIG